MKNTTIYGVGALVLLVAGYFLVTKNKKSTSLSTTLPSSTEPVKVDREKLALEFTEKNFVPSPFDNGNISSGLVKSTGLQFLGQGSNNGQSVSAQPLRPRNKITYYKDLLDILNKITDDNDVLPYLDALRNEFKSLNEVLFMEKLSKKYPTIKFD